MFVEDDSTRPFVDISPVQVCQARREVHVEDTGEATAQLRTFLERSRATATAGHAEEGHGQAAAPAAAPEQQYSIGAALRAHRLLPGGHVLCTYAGAHAVGGRVRVLGDAAQCKRLTLQVGGWTWEPEEEAHCGQEGVVLGLYRAGTAQAGCEVEFDGDKRVTSGAPSHPAPLPSPLPSRARREAGPRGLVPLVCCPHMHGNTRAALRVRRLGGGRVVQGWCGCEGEGEGEGEGAQAAVR